MRKPTLVFSLVVAALLAPLSLRAPQAQTVSAAAPAPAIARVIVKYKVGSTLLRRTIQSATAEQASAQVTSQALALGQRVGIALGAGASVSDRSHVVTATGMSSAQLAQRLATDSEIEYAVPDVFRKRLAVPNDQFYNTRAVIGNTAGPTVGQWYLKAPGGPSPVPAASTANTAPSAIDAEHAWDLTTGSASIVVAVLDTGIRFDHADFKRVINGGNLLDGYDMIANDAVSGDGQAGRDSDASDTGDFVTQADVDNPATGCSAGDIGSSSWHGTETTGLIGAVTDNLIGIASVGRNVRVLPVRVLGKCGGFDSDIVAGMLWAAGIAVPGVPPLAVANRARVLNMSLGGTGACDSTAQAYVNAIAQINAMGAVIVASAGNTAGHSVSLPADCAGVIGVAGLRHVGTKVGFSDLGPEITIAAPGGNCINVAAGSECRYPILTTSNAGTTVPVTHANGGSVYSDSFGRLTLGTSFSAPLVAGTAALMLSVNPALTPAQVKTLLQQTANAFPTTGGSINATASAGAVATLPVTLSATNSPQCVAPTSADQLECYCTAATCGAGMLDANSAVRAAMNLSFTPTTPGQRRVVSYLWNLVDGGGIVTAISNPTASNATATPTDAGTFVVSLTTVDDLGTSTTSPTTTVTVAAVPVVTPPPASSGGGGGTLGVGWLLLLLGCVVALRFAPPVPTRSRD